MDKRRFSAWLSTLVVPLAVALSIHHWPDTARTPSIGGGGYDLSGLIFTVATLAFIGAWTLLALIVACFQKDDGRQRRGFALTAIGGVAFAGALILYGHNLS